MTDDFHVVAANLIEIDRKYLLVQEGKEEVRGKWNLPAGGMKQGEDIEEAAKREAREETGLKAEPESLLGVFIDKSDVEKDKTVLIFVFSSKTENFEVEKPQGDEIMDLSLFLKEEISDLDLRVPFILECIERYEASFEIPLEALKDFR